MAHHPLRRSAPRDTDHIRIPKRTLRRFPEGRFLHLPLRRHLLHSLPFAARGRDLAVAASLWPAGFHLVLVKRLRRLMLKWPTLLHQRGSFLAFDNMMLEAPDPPLPTAAREEASQQHTLQGLTSSRLLHVLVVHPLLSHSRDTPVPGRGGPFTYRTKKQKSASPRKKLLRLLRLDIHRLELTDAGKRLVLQRRSEHPNLYEGQWREGGDLAVDNFRCYVKQQQMYV